MPAAGAVTGSASRRKRITGRLDPGRALELQSDGDEVVWRPRARVAEGELSFVPLPDLADFRVEELGLIATDEERGVHDHLVPDHLVGTRGDRGFAKLVVDLPDVRIRLVAERLLDHAAELHPREIRRRLLVRLDLRLETPQLLVLLFELGQDGIAVPVHLEAELELVLHFLEDVTEHVVRVLEELDRVFFGLEQGPEAHRHGGEPVVDHDDLVDVLVVERVLARGVVHLERGVSHYGGEVTVVNGEDFVVSATNADLPEASRLLGLDDAVDVDAGFLLARRRGHRGLHHTSGADALSCRNSRVSSYSFSRSSRCAGRRP